VSLLAACVRRGLRVLSAMGAGARADPTRIRVADLRESSNDPLSRTVYIDISVQRIKFTPPPPEEAAM
jgi:tRNA A37 threonylcarbamoyladenosine dehydratase